jgi:Rps23 Pro-64 3,4-dihydroxylase Tpa1-like proline 4-hydroxylase
METPEPTNNTEQSIDQYWVVSNIFALIAFLEDKFGPTSVEQIVAAATTIEEAMRKESEGTQ